MCFNLLSSVSVPPLSARPEKMTREIEMQEMDWAAFPKPSEEMQSRWLLQPSTMLKKKTNARKKAYAWSLVVLIGVLAVLGFSMMIRALTHRHHHQQQQTPEIYSSALHAGLKFFNSQRCKSNQNNLVYLLIFSLIL